MKIAFILVLFSSSVIGVFADTDKLKSVPVMEGDSVTLHTGVTKILGSDSMEWRFKGIRMAKIKSNSPSTEGPFRDTMQLNNATGDLKITNVTTTDSGLYKLIKKGRELSEMTFNVTVDFDADKDPVKKVPVTVGESVTLKTKKQSDEVMKWRFGPQKTLIAELKVQADRFTVYDDVLDGRFRDRLKLDNQNGSLTITNITTEHDGDYEAELRGSGYTIHKAFNVTVIDVRSMSVEEGGSVPLYTGLTQIQTDDVILWRFGAQDNIIASLNGPDVYKRWSNVYLNKQTGDLNISNIRRDQFGDYKVEINTINMISHRKYHIISVTVTSVLVMEGDSVTLHTGAPIPRNAVLWYGDNDTLISSVDPRWSNTVGQTGDLTIRNIRGDQSGDYKIVFTNVQMFSMRIHRKFHINITGVFSDETGGLKTVSVMKGDSVFLDTSVTEIQNGDLIEWLFEPQNIIIAKTDGNSNIIYNEKDVRFKNRLNLDNQTGDLTIENSNSEHSGRYQLKIINNTYTIQKSFSVTVRLSPVVPDPDQSSGAVAGIVITVIVTVAAAVGGLIYYYLKSSKPERSREVNGQNHTSDKDVETELTEPPKAAEQQQFI